MVRRRKWVDEAHFMDMVSAVNFIPGPNATELAIHIGQLRAGTPGLVIAGACFIVPAMLISIPLAWAYAAWGTLPQAVPTLRAIGAAIVAVVVAATVRFGRTALASPFAIAVGASAPRPPRSRSPATRASSRRSRCCSPRRCSGPRAQRRGAEAAAAARGRWRSRCPRSSGPKPVA